MNGVVLVNSVLCLLGTIGGAFFALASIISIANMKSRWAGVLLVAAFGVPITFLVSGVGVWLAENHGSARTTSTLIALPWFWTLLFVIGMVRALRS